MIRILFLGDIVGEPGRKAVMDKVPRLKKELQIDFVVVNGENAAGGRGITPKITIDLLRSGVAVITTGDHVWDQRETLSYIETEPRLLRPANYPEGTPGAGWVVLECEKGKVGVISVQGRTFTLPALENPFLAVQPLIEQIRRETPVVLVDMHAETTSEKISMGRFLDGKASAVIGTHTHVQTADEQIFPGGTAFLCDAGMCGGHDSILGRKPEPIIRRFLTGLPSPFPIAKSDVRISGALIDVDERTGKALAIKRIMEPWTAPEPAGQTAAAPAPAS